MRYFLKCQFIKFLEIKDLQCKSTSTCFQHFLGLIIVIFFKSICILIVCIYMFDAVTGEFESICKFWFVTRQIIQSLLQKHSRYSKNSNFFYSMMSTCPAFDFKLLF